MNISSVNIKKIINITALSLTLYACGGGGGGEKTSAPTPAPIVNSPPVLSSTPLTSIAETQLYQSVLAISDADGDTLTVSVENLPAWANFDSSSRTISGTPSLSDAGSYPDIKITANDGKGAVELSSFTIEVENSVQVSGKVIDGYIQGAIVFIDENKNSLLDESELSVVSNDTGYFSFVILPEYYNSYTSSPIRAYVGEGASDISRPELNFTQTPIVISTLPLTSITPDTQLYEFASISPFTNNLVQRLNTELSQFADEQLSKEQLNTLIAEHKQAIFDSTFSFAPTDLSESDLDTEQMLIDLFHDFMAPTNAIPISFRNRLAAIAADQLDEIIKEQDIRDTDNDGIPNNEDNDDDGDGINDEDDLFPLDSTENMDSDGDGVGDNTDAYANDATCSIATDGNGTHCYMTWLASNQPQIIKANGVASFYFFHPDWSKILEYNNTTGHFATSVDVENASTIEYSSSEQRLYIGFNDGKVRFVNESNQLEDFISVTLNNSEASITSITPLEQHFAIYSSSSRELYIYNQAGELTASRYIGSNQNQFTYNATLSRLYYTAYNSLYYLTVDVNNGTIINDQYLGHFNNIRNFIKLSENDEKILLGNGQVYELENFSPLNTAQAYYTEQKFGFWLTNDEYAILTQTDNSNLLNRFNADFQIIEQITIDSNVQATFSELNQNYFILSNEQHFSIMHYVASEDSDGDGVSNNEDKFPLDIAASVDTDNDGFPDNWNTGYTEFDSTTGLILDEFPLDSACWTAEHGLDGSCDYTATLPTFTPSQIAYDKHDDIYLLSSENNAIYRWSASTNHYTNPIRLGTLPQNIGVPAITMAYLPEQNRIYIGYSNGYITYVETSNPTQEHHFTSLSGQISSLNSAGNYLLASDTSQSTKYIFDSSATQTGSFYEYSNNPMLWSTTNNTAYLNKNNRVYAYQINQVTGLLIDESYSEYENIHHSDSSIRLSADNENIVTGSGSVYDLSLTKIANFEHIANDNTRTVDHYWHSDALISTTREYNYNNDQSIYNLHFWDQSYRARGTQLLQGSILAITPNDDDIIIVSQSDSDLLFTKYVISDHDEDGIPGWWEVLNSFDDNDASDAATDTDNDGLTNLEEFQYATDPNNNDSDNDGLLDGEEINTHLTNPLNNDSDGDGLSDGQEVNEYGTNPLAVDSDSDGLTDYDEVITYQSNPLLADSDEDGLLDLYEVENGLNPNLNDSQLDLDEDGLTNQDEFTQNTDPRVADTDFDGIFDGAEVHSHQTDPLDKDSDNDRMYDGFEVTYNLNPLNDTDAELDGDNDGFSNMEEFFLKTNPTDSSSFATVPNWTMYQGNAGNTGFTPVFINSENITQRWEIDANSQNRQVIASDGTAYIASYNDDATISVRAINAANALQKWQSDFDNTYQSSTLALANNKVFMQTRGNSYYLRALDAENGSLFYRVNSNYLRNSKYSATPWQEDLYIANDSHVKAIDSNGQDKWDSNYSTNNYYSSLALNDNSIYVPNNGLDIVNRTSGERVSHIPYPEDFSSSSFLYNTPVIGHNEQVALVSNNTLFNFDTENGVISWQIELNNSNNRQVSIAYGRIFSAQNELLKVYDELTGSLSWSWETDNNEAINYDILLTRNLAFVGTTNTTYAIDLATHETVWQTDITGQMSISAEGALYIASTEKVVAFNIAGDSDGDGMADWWEDFYGFDKNNADDASLDADTDGLSNLEEFQAKTDPLVSDSDADGIEDGDEINTYSTDPLNSDSDNDGISDGDEVDTHGTNPLAVDSDNDGVNDYDEINVYSSNPLAEDTDADGILDGWEVQYGLDINLDDAQIDTDSDNLVNIDEQTSGTDPTNSDTDNDGLLDGDEVHTHLTEPLLFDTDSDRMSDGWEITHSLAPTDDSDALADNDNDNFANVEEYFLNTDPNDSENYAIATPWVTFQGNASHDGFSLYTINADEITQLWQIELSYNPNQISAAENKVYVTSITGTKKVQAFNSSSGTELWSLDFGSINSITPPAYANGKVFFQTGGHSDSFLRGVNATTGTVEFESSYGNQWSNYFAPTPYENDIYIAGGYYGGMYGFTQTGEEKFFTSLEQYDGWTPSVDDTLMYGYTGPTLTAVNRQTGELEFSITDENYDWNGWTTPGAGVLGSLNNFVTVERNRLISFDLENKDIAWEKSANYINEAAIAYGRVYVNNGGVLEVLDEYTGELLWSFEADEDLTQNIAITRNLVFISSNSKTYAVDIDSHESAWEVDTFGQLAISEGILYIAGDQKLTAYNIDGDDDSDGMTNWWELTYGLDKNDPDDALLDKDDDGLSNLLEFTHSSNPTVTDSDNDGLTDGDEVNTHLSNPILTDTDQDRLSDGDEINVYNTSPIIIDSDEDGYNDGDEVLIFSTDPADANSVPEAIATLIESFEADSIPTGWTTPDSSFANWYITSDMATEGIQSIRAGSISHNQESTIEFQALFDAGTFSFDVKVDSESCCDHLKVYLDDELMHSVNSNVWATKTIEIPAGLHILKFQYSKDGSASTGDDTAWLDNVNFN